MNPYDPTQPTQPSFLQRLLSTLPQMVQGGIDAAATPNVAFGGPTDIFRALQNAGQMSQQRDIAAEQMRRQRLQDILAQNKDQLAQQNFLRQLQQQQDLINHQKAMEQAASRRADIEEQQNQAAQTGAFVGRGGEFPDTTTSLMASPLQLPAPQQATASAQDIPMAPPMRSPLSIPTPVREGYQMEPRLATDQPGKMRIAPTAATLATQKKTAEQANWPSIRNQDQSDFFGLDIGTKVSPTEYSAYSVQHRQDTKPAPEEKFNYTPEIRAALVAAGAKDPSNPTQPEMVAAFKQLAGLKQSEHPPSAPGSSPDDPKVIAQAIKDGLQPPNLQGLYRMGGPVRAELARNGYDLATAQRDWNAIQKHLATLNGAQQERLRQAITFTADSVPIIEDLYAKWLKVGPASGYKVFNKAALAAAANVPGEAGSVASNLLSQINDLSSELGTVYKGGNSSTDESLRLAATNLQAEWNEQTFKDAIKRLKQNLNIRKNSILTSAPVGVSQGSPYLPTPSGGQPQATGGVPNVGDQFQGGKVLKVEKIK